MLCAIVKVAVCLQVLQWQRLVAANESGTTFQNTALSPADKSTSVSSADLSSTGLKKSDSEERNLFGFGNDETNGAPPSVNDDGTLVITTPIPGAPPPPTYKDLKAKFGGLLDKFDSTSDSTEGSASRASPTPVPETDATVSLDASDSDDIEPPPTKKQVALLTESLSSDASADVGTDDLSALLGNSSNSDPGSGAPTAEDMAALTELMGSGLDTSGSMLSFEDFAAKFGTSLSDGMPGGDMNLFGDPMEPQNLTVNDNDIVLGELYGGLEHGDAFSDVKNIKFGQMFLNISLHGSERVDRVALTAMTQETYVTMSHGGDGGTEGFFEPEMGDTVQSIEIQWDKNKGKTCIFYMKISTSTLSVSTGVKTNNGIVLTPPENYQFAGFHGRANGNGIFCIGAIWTKLTASDLYPNDVMALPPQASADVYTYNHTVRNWVGPVVAAVDSACYQKRFEVSRDGLCPSGYNKDDDDCVAQCPLDYPLDCFKECIPQNADCAQTVAAKVASVLAVVLNAATLGTFGALAMAIKTTRLVLMCAISIINAVKSLLFYLRYKQTIIPTTDMEKLMDHAFQVQIVILDLPLAICSCLGIQIPNKLMFSVFVLTVVSAIVMVVVSVGEAIFGSKENVMLMLRESGAMNTTELDNEAIELDEFLNNKSTTCGYQIRTLTNRVIGLVMTTRNNTPNADPEDVRVAVSQSPIMIEDVPIVTNHCMGEIWANKTSEAAYKTRNMLRKTLRVIVEQLIEDGTTDMGKELAHKEKVFEYTNTGLFVLSMLDPTGIAWMASEFVQPICGPTMYIGEIDDGTLYDALGLNTVDQAFLGSYGIWKKKGDGSVTILFESVDKYEVSVVIKIAGEKQEEVRVPAKGKVKWTSTVEKLQDKTLYLDRWRPGLFGLPGKGGGSLLMWVPRSSEGGKLILHARLNVS